MTILALQGLGLPAGPPIIPTEPKVRPVRKWRKRTDRPLISSSKPSPDRVPFTFTTQLSTNPQARRVSDKSTKSNRTSRSAETAHSRRSAWSGKSFKSGSWKSNSSNRSIKSKRSSRFRARRLPPLDLHHPLSRLAEALDLANVGAPSAKERRATKAALALRQLILDPPQFEVCAVALPTAMTGPAAVGGADQVPVIQMAMTPETPSAGNGNNTLTTVGTKGKKSFVPRLREKDVSRLRTQLLKPTEAKMVIAHARSLPVDALSNHDRAVCLNCPENEADGLIEAAHRVEDVRRQEEARASEHRVSTIKPSHKPSQEQQQPPRLPVLLSLYSGLTAAGVMPGSGIDPSINLLGLFEPASAMSLHRPLAGALPSAETLRRGFDALINAESKVYMYKGPSHRNIHPPTDRMSVYTYWWGFELALPPATMAYLAHAKSIATSVLNLLSVIVYAVPGGTRELAPFVGVLSRFIDNEWALLKSQDRGKGVVCGATWFIPAALVARPWDFGEESIRDRLIAEEERELLEKERINPDAVLRIQGPEGEQEEGVVVGIAKAMVQPSAGAKKRDSPKLPWTSGKRGDASGGGNKGGAEGAVEKTEPPQLRTIPKALSPPLPGRPAANGSSGMSKDEPNHDPTKAPKSAAPPAITMPVFTTLLHQKAESAPASPTRTDPPTPARARFGNMWRMRVNKGSDVDSSEQKQKRSARGKEVVGSKGDHEMVLNQQGEALGTHGDGDDVGGVSTAAPLQEVSTATITSEAIELSDLVAPGPAEGSIAAESTVADDKEPLSNETALDPVSRTLMSRTMRRVRGTMGRLRITGLGFSSPTLQLGEQDKAEKERIGPADSLENDSISRVDATENDARPTGRSKQFWASTRVQRRSSRGQIPWSIHETGAQTVREKNTVTLRRSLVVLEM